MVDVSELDSIIAQIRKVKYGDYVLSDDHNLQTDAIKKIRDILSGIEVAAPAAAPIPPSPLSPSNLDPNDSAWTPETGWSKVFQFDTLSELQEWANDYFANGDVENSVVYSTVANGMDLERSCNATQTPAGISKYKFAICFAIPYVHMATGYRPPITISTNYGEIDVQVRADSNVKIFIYDTTDSSLNGVWNTYQWLVLLVDYENNICKLFDHNKNVIFEKTMVGSPAGAIDNFWIALLQEEWFTTDNAISKHWWLFVDWWCEYYAVAQECPTGAPPSPP